MCYQVSFIILPGVDYSKWDKLGGGPTAARHRADFVRAAGYGTGGGRGAEDGGGSQGKAALAAAGARAQWRPRQDCVAARAAAQSW